jgi:hypothetical protein
VLLLKEQHLQEMAVMARAVSPRNPSSVDDAAAGGRAKGQAEANKQLLAQLEAVRQEQRRAVEQVRR